MKNQWTEIGFTTFASGKSSILALPLLSDKDNIILYCQVPPAQYLPRAGLAVAAGCAPRPHLQHRVYLEPKGGAVQGDGAVPGRLKEDLPRHALQHQDHRGLAAREKLPEGRSLPTFLI